TGVVADDVTQHAHQQSGADQLGPALGDTHAGGGSGPADIGVGGQDGVLQIRLEELGGAEAEQHVHNDHDQAQHQQQRGLGDHGVDVGGNADDEQEQIDELGADLLGAVELGGRPLKEGGHDHGDGGDPHILAAQELADKVLNNLHRCPGYALHSQGAEDISDHGGNPHHSDGIGQVHGDIP